MRRTVEFYSKEDGMIYAIFWERGDRTDKDAMIHEVFVSFDANIQDWILGWVEHGILPSK
jgi:hypothetical protein